MGKLSELSSKGERNFCSITGEEILVPRSLFSFRSRNLEAKVTCNVHHLAVFILQLKDYEEAREALGEITERFLDTFRVSEEAFQGVWGFSWKIKVLLWVKGESFNPEILWKARVFAFSKLISKDLKRAFSWHSGNLSAGKDIQQIMAKL